MKRKTLIGLILVLFFSNLTMAATLPVPSSRYQTIQSALDDAVNGDVVVVAPGTYTGGGNSDLDFHQRAVTLKSWINPANPDPNIVAGTIIDCGGTLQNPHRAIYFFNVGNNTKVQGFTIINGYQRGPRGADGQREQPVTGDIFVDPENEEEYGYYAKSGKDAIGNGQGGAIYCLQASPTIEFCVIRNCQVAGALGGDGADGFDGIWRYVDPEDPNNLIEVRNGQWAGDGGDGRGTGYGGAIACANHSSPIIRNCRIENNIARGGCGGNGGNGGEGDAASNMAGAGGNGGDSIGDGRGGGLYSDSTSRPVVVDCHFINNTATTGERSKGGLLGEVGSQPSLTIDEEVIFFGNGSDGPVYASGTWIGGVCGGAAYFDTPGAPDFNDCNFVSNKAYEAYFNYDPLWGPDIARYTEGGAIFLHRNNNAVINKSTFGSNLGGAIYCRTGNNLNITDSSFASNAEIPQGGAIFIDSGGNANLTNCTFAANSAYDDGGAIYSLSSVSLADCSFGGNIAEGLHGGFTGCGGAVDVYSPTAIVDVNVNADNCIFSGNQAVYGGGFFGDANANFYDCYFVTNIAEVGGGLYVEYGSILIEGGTIKQNTATRMGGGGLSCVNNDVTIVDCSIMDNAAEGVWGYGGGIDLSGTQGSVHELFNCLFTGNTADYYGGAVYCQDSAPFIGSCTFSGNSTARWGGGVFSNFESYVYIIDSIFHDCNSHAVHEEDYGGYATVSWSLFYENPNGDFYDGTTRTVYTGADEINGVPGGKNRFNYDGSGFPPGQPLFVPGPLGGFYLNQSLVPPVDSGSGDADDPNISLDTYTTRTDSVPDAGIVDLGYHYLRSIELPPVKLTVGITKGSGTIEPTSPAPLDYDPNTNTYTYGAGTVVTITTAPDPGWIVESWTGTDDYVSTALTNTVFMNADRDVTVAFTQPKTLIVKVGGGANYYENIQDAVYHAEDGDTIVVLPGVYYGGYMAVILQIDKSVTIRSLNPADPCCVATTIIDGYLDFYDPDEEDDFSNRGVWFFPGVNAVLNGFTIQNCGGGYGLGLNGNRNLGHPNGYEGGYGEGPAILIWGRATVLVKNCIIKDNLGWGGEGGNGVNASDRENAGRGGWGGWSYGGAVYCGPESTSTFRNCQIVDNEARGGDGGDGGNGLPPTGGIGNYGGGWSRAQALDVDPGSLAVTWSNGDLWEVWTDGDGWIDGYGNIYSGYKGDPRWYTGYGGGVFCDQASEVTFIDCTISRNRAFGGVTGQGGIEWYDRFMEPLNPFELPSFGGGVYCAAESVVRFDGCTIAENIASRPANTSNHHRDPYLGHGGGVCAEDTALVEFIDCHVSDNQACVGGGLHWANANPEIIDCNFVSNSAYQGGAIYGDHGPAIIADCNIIGNRASVDEPIEPNDPNIVATGEGGGLHLWATTAEIYDCNIQANYASSSGGGAYFGGEYEPLLFNCLIANNIADRDGAGVSTNIFAQLHIQNCTIADNVVTSVGFGTGYGGGVSTSYETTTNIIDSIIWGNRAANGMQLSIGTGFEHDPCSSAVYVSYSDIGPPYDPNNPFDFDTFDVEPLPSGEPGGSDVITDHDNIYGQFNAGQNTVKIIISLFEPEQLRQTTDWDSPGSVYTLRAEIDARQDSVLASFTPGEFTLRHRFENQAGFSGEVTQAGLNRLLADSLVQYIEPVRYVQPALAQGIPLINADIYRSTYNGRGIAVAICDTGVDYWHPMLGGGGFPNTKVIGGYDWGIDDSDPIPDMGWGPTAAHGTACAGIAAGDIGAVGDYIGGVAHNAKIYALKIADSYGEIPTDAGTRAWDWCITHRNDNPQNPIKVISNSWSEEYVFFADANQADEFSPAATRAVQLAVDLGITILASSGNEYLTDRIAWPAAMSNVISVGAVHDVTDTVMGYSNTAEVLDILAPSHTAYTTDIIGPAGYDPCDYDPNFGGTSAACPYAAGAVAVLQSAAFARAGQYLTPAQVKHLLTETGVPITDTKVLITKPRIDLAAAINNLPGSPVYVEQTCALHGWDYNSVSYAWDPNFDDYSNISADPDFIAGYLLEQVTAGQAADSPCVDTGSAPAALLTLDLFTTRTDSVPDAGIVDMGYHYNPFIVHQYYLTVTAWEKDGHMPVIIQPDPSSGYQDWFRQVALEIDDVPAGYEVVWAGTDDDSIVERYNTVTINSNRNVVVTFEPNQANLEIIVIGKGTVLALPHEPNSPYARGTVVTLEATPDDGYRLGSWSGTDNDISIAVTNTVTMNTDRTVTVTFELPATLNVPGDYSSIQQAFDVAREGDIIMLGTGIWGTSQGYYIYDTPVTITSTAPDDPCVVANTVIEMQTGTDSWVGGAFTFYNVGPEAVLNGITIRGFQMGGLDGLDPEGEEIHGKNGTSVSGGAINCWNASPTIKNCIIEDCNITGGDGSDGVNGTATDPHGGHGGWPGYGFGGGLACLENSNPTVINCIFRNCGATGGSGGDGGNGVAISAQVPGGGDGGRGGGWYYFYPVGWQYGPYEFYTRYSGKGGAVYVGPGCAPVFNHCTFTNNSSFSGNSGICGQDAANLGRDEPSIRYVIENSGGAVYCDSASSTTFTDCVFNGNVADINDPANNDDPYVGLGGAVAFEDDASVTFDNCSFNGNTATLGGAIYSANALTDITDCNFVDNRAYHGGGLFCTDSDLTVIDSNIAENYASVMAINAPNDFNNIEVLGQGGGIYCGSSDTRIIDSTISSNIADASGGGMYFSGGQDNALINCLLADNEAGRDGGAISADWNCVLNMANCTVADNSATGSATFESAYGGGLFCGYDSNTSVVDSIFWDNSAQNGQQLGIGTGFEFGPSPSVLNVSYSDIKDARFRVYVDTGCTLNWGSGNFSQDPNFVTGSQGDYYLSQTSTGDPCQTVDSPCVDAGSDSAHTLGMDRYTTRTNHIFDHNIVDVGYHYSGIEAVVCSYCDLYPDGVVDLNDIALFTDQWLNEDCSLVNAWCNGSDMNFDRLVDFRDYIYFAQCWLVEKTTTPLPNPSQWLQKPYAMTTEAPYIITMTARTTVDLWGDNIQYYFECFEGPGNDSGWQDSPTYRDTVYAFNTEYGYRVKARHEAGDETDWSIVAYAITSGELIDMNSPQPDPMTWEVAPVALSLFDVRMLATTAVDNNDPNRYVEYQFDCVSGGGRSRSWGPDPNYIDTGLTADTTYCYRVRARDESSNITQWSQTLCATTMEDTDIPVPSPPTWATEPYAVSATSITMVVDPVSDPSGVQYYFDCTSHAQYSSAWQTDTTYQVTVPGNDMYTFVVRARDMSFNYNTTADSNAVIVDLLAPAPAPVFVLDPNAPPVTGYFQIGQDWYHRIVVTANAADASGVDYYRVICLTNGAFSSGQLQPVGGIIEYIADIEEYGGQHSSELEWQVVVYDIYGNSAASPVIIVGGGGLF